MAQFERIFEDLDVQMEGVTGALDAVAGATSEDNQAVMELLQQLQSQQALDQNNAIGAVNQNKIKSNAVAQPAAAEQNHAA